MNSQRACATFAAASISDFAALPRMSGTPGGSLPAMSVWSSMTRNGRCVADERVTDKPADAPVPDDDRMPGERRRLGHLGLHLRRRTRLLGFLRVSPAVEQREQERIDDDRDDRAGEDEILRLLRHHFEPKPEAGQNEREFADLRQADRDRQRGSAATAERAHDQVGHDRFAEHDDREGRGNGERVLHDHRGIEQHADRDEEQHRERIAERQ